MRAAVIMAGALAVVAPAVAHADRLAVKVVEVAGGIAYLEPGGAAGLAPGTKIEFGPVTRVVLEVTDGTAAIRLDGLVVSIGQTGAADVVPGHHAVEIKRAKVHAEGAFRDQWPEPARPADRQEVKHVPLGAARPGGAIHVAVLGHGYATVGRGNTAAEG